MCGSTNVMSLEHYLAKADYPEFYIFSLNLIPSCMTCNQKRGKIANAPGTALPLLHPYFDGKDLDSRFLITEFILPFDAPIFRATVDSYQLTGAILARAQRHIVKSIDTDIFHNWSKGLWAEWRSKAYLEPDLASLLKVIKKDLSAHEKAAGPNTWTAAFLRGLLTNTNAAEWLRLNP
jgi:hypothetical protein